MAVAAGWGAELQAVARASMNNRKIIVLNRNFIKSSGADSNSVFLERIGQAKERKLLDSGCRVQALFGYIEV
jgi:hypothetical protein